jgi:PAS domain S-box-containing protein
MTSTGGTVSEIVKTLDMASVEMLIISLPDSRIVDITSSLANVWNCSKYEAVGQQLSQSAQSPFFARYVNTSLTDIGGNADLRIEVVTTNASGKKIARTFKPRHYKDGTAEYLMLIGSSTATTEAAYDDEQESRLRLALEAGGYSTWEAEFENHTATFSTELFESLGMSPDNLTISNAKWTTLVHPEDIPKTLDNMVARAEDDIKFIQTAYRVKHGDGHYVWVEMIARIIKDPITKTISKLLGLCRDISEEMHRRHQIETSEQNLARSQALAKMGSWVMDLKTGEVEWSDHMFALFGAGKSQTGLEKFTPMTDLMDAEQREKWLETLEFAKNGHQISGLECEFDHPDGEKHRLSIHIDIEFNHIGEPGRLHGICKDITEQVMLERKFLQAQKMESVGQLTGGIAHDFNNLLMVVLGNLQLLEKLTRDDEKAATRLVTAIDAVNKGSELTKRLLAFSRQQTLEDETIPVNELVESMRDMLVRATNSTIELEINPGDDIWPVKADKTQLETAILNLAINARDAMKDGGKLTINTANTTLDANFTREHEDLIPGDYVVISVTDTGHGMPADIIDKVLQPFFTTKAPGSGSGLGLSMIYGFAKQSKGHLMIESEVDKGTKISIYLPRNFEEEKPARQTETADPQETETVEVKASIQTRQPIVLIAEDNDPVRDVAVAMIEDMDYIVLDAANGEAALEIIKQRDDIDLLLSDVVMPGMNGPELAAAALEIRPDLKVLFASGYTQGTAEEMHELPNFIELIDKPFTQKDLTNKVRAAVEESRRNKKANAA